MLTLVDANGYSATMLKDIIDYHKNKDVTVAKADKNNVTWHMQKKMIKTTIW